MLRILPLYPDTHWFQDLSLRVLLNSRWWRVSIQLNLSTKGKKCNWRVGNFGWTYKPGNYICDRRFLYCNNTPKSGREVPHCLRQAVPLLQQHSKEWARGTALSMRTISTRVPTPSKLRPSPPENSRHSRVQPRQAPHQHWAKENRGATPTRPQAVQLMTHRHLRVSPSLRKKIDLATPTSQSLVSGQTPNNRKMYTMTTLADVTLPI